MGCQCLKRPLRPRATVLLPPIAHLPGQSWAHSGLLWNTPGLWATCGRAWTSPAARPQCHRAPGLACRSRRDKWTQASGTPVDSTHASSQVAHESLGEEGGRVESVVVQPGCAVWARPSGPLAGSWCEANKLLFIAGKWWEAGRGLRAAGSVWMPVHGLRQSPATSCLSWLVCRMGGVAEGLGAAVPLACLLHLAVQCLTCWRGKNSCN